jgi:hypothetical protein
MTGIRDLPMHVRIAVTNSSNVAFEMADIGGIESYLNKKILVHVSEAQEIQS